MSILNMRLSKKLPLLIVMFAFITAIGVSYFIYKEVAEKLTESNRSALFSLMDNKSSELTNYLNSLEQDIKFMSSATQTKKALLDFKSGYEQFGAGAKDALQKLYITDNPNPTGSKHLLDYAEDGSTYSAIHKENMPWIRSFLVQRDYYDIFLIDTNGNVVFTVFKELDYATNVSEGEWKDTDIGNAFRKAMETASGEVHFFDFKPYKPSFDDLQALSLHV